MNEKQKERLRGYLTGLIGTPSPTGLNRQITEYLCGQLRALGLEPKQLRKGGVYAQVCEGGDPLLIMSHVDDIGLMVHRIKPNGHLAVTNVGGLHAPYCDQENVLVHTRGGAAVSGCVRLENPSLHVSARDHTLAARSFTENTEVVLDEDVRSAEDAEALGIRVGDLISVDPRLVFLGNGYIKSRFLDDKSSSAVLLTYLSYLHETGKTPKRGLWVDFTMFEEIGHGGAWIPDGIADVLAVDIGPVGDSTGCDEHKVSICLKDAAFPYNREMSHELIETCERAGIPHSLDLYLPSYGSDADVVLRSGHDVRHALIGPGVLATHGYERTHIDALAAVFDLLCAYTL